MVALLASEGRKASLPVFVDQWTRNGSIDLVEAGIAAFAHTPVRDFSDEAIATSLRLRDIRIITTLAVLRIVLEDKVRESVFSRDTSHPGYDAAVVSRRLALPCLGTAGRPPSRSRADTRRAGECQEAFRCGAFSSRREPTLPTPESSREKDLHRELELLVEAGLTPLEAISVGTRNASRLMNAEERVGNARRGQPRER